MVSTVSYLIKKKQLVRVLSSAAGSITLSAPNSGRGLQPPDICLKSSTVNRKQSSKILKCIKDNFLIEVVKSPTRRESLLDLLLANVK